MSEEPASTSEAPPEADAPKQRGGPGPCCLILLACFAPVAWGIYTLHEYERRYLEVAAPASAHYERVDSVQLIAACRTLWEDQLQHGVYGDVGPDYLDSLSLELAQGPQALEARDRATLPDVVKQLQAKVVVVMPEAVVFEWPAGFRLYVCWPQGGIARGLMGIAEHGTGSSRVIRLDPGVISWAQVPDGY